MRPVGVVLDVVLDPERVDRRLHGLQVGPGLDLVEQFPLQRLVEPLHLPGRGRRPGLGVARHGAVLPADPLEQHLHRIRPGEPAGELLAVVGEHLLRDPEPTQGLHEGQTHRPSGGPTHHIGDHAVPGVIIDPGDHLRLAPAGQADPTDDVQLPQLHRPFPLPAAVVLPTPTTRHRADQAMPDQHPVDRGQRRHRTGTLAPAQLELQPTFPPPRMPPAQLTDRRLDLRAGLLRMPVRAVRAIRQPVQALLPIPADPPMHRLPRDTEPLGHLGHRHTGLDLQHGPVPLLRHGQLHQHSAECHASTGTNL